jgi:hypothetical protein
MKAFSVSLAASAAADLLQRVCLGCGCTDDNACVDEETGRTCTWFLDNEMDVCSFCAAIAIAMAEADERDVAERSARPLVELVSDYEADLFIRNRRARGAGA